MLHLLKLCVGCDSIEDLARWQDGRRLRGQPLEHHTRNMPRRAAEILAGGSLYWVVRGRILVRQRILALAPGIEEGGERFCRIGLDPALVPTVPRPQRPLQGWRYLEAADAPADLGRGGAAIDADSATLAAELHALGLG